MIFESGILLIIRQISIFLGDLANYNRFARRIAIQELSAYSANLGHMMPPRKYKF